MNELIQQYLAHMQASKGTATTTLKTYKHAILYFFKFCSHHQEEMYLPETWQISDISVRELEYFLREHLFQRGWKEDTLVTYVSALRSFYYFLLESHQIDNFPFPNFKLKRHLREIHLSQISREEMQKLFEMAIPDTFEGIRNRLLLELAYGLGIPLKQLALIRKITPSSKTILVDFEEKNETFPIATKAMKLLQSYQEQSPENPPTFWRHKNGIAMKYKDIEDALKKELSPIEMLKQRPSLLRELSAQHFSESGADIRSLQKFREVKYLRRMQSFKHKNFSDLQKRFNQAHPHERVENNN